MVLALPVFLLGSLLGAVSADFAITFPPGRTAHDGIETTLCGK